MNTDPEYIQKNKQTWNERTDHHIASEFYNVDNFIKGASSLNDIELNLLGNVAGKSILHLQCHFGQDSLSLARIGAHVTGVDFSEKAIDKARELAKQLNFNIDFIESDIYDLPKHLTKQFDIVFTSYGTIGWFPDLDKWAGVVSHFLKPGGSFVFAEFHPVVWMYDNDFTKIEYSYFKADPIKEIEEGTYADTSAPIKTETITWNHSLGEVFTALLKNNMKIISFEEFNYSPYNSFRDMEVIEEKKFIIKKFGNKIPLVYALKAMK